MEDYDSEEDLCLTQSSSKDYAEAPSYQFGEDVIENVVSLEATDENPNFEMGFEVSQISGGRRILYDNVEIEDI